MKDFVDDYKLGVLPEFARKAMDSLQKGNTAYREYIEAETKKTVASGGFSVTEKIAPIVSEVVAPQNFDTLVDKPKKAKKRASLFTQSRVNDYVPPKVAEGVYGFKVNAQTLTALLSSGRSELANVEVKEIPDDGSEKIFAVKVDNDAGNKYLSELAKPKDPIQMDANALNRILGSENSILQSANIDVVMVDADHPSFAERPYSVQTSNDKAYNLIRAIAVDTTIAYEGEVVLDAEDRSPVALASNVVAFPTNTTKTKFSGLKLLARAAAFVGAMMAPWNGETGSRQAAQAATAVQAEITDTLISPLAPEINFMRPSLTSDEVSPTALTPLFPVASVTTLPVVDYNVFISTPSEPVTYVTQSGDTLWRIVEREFDEQGVSKGEGYAKMLDRLDQYVEANPSLAFNPNALQLDHALVIPDIDAPRAECDWSRARKNLGNVCKPSV